MQFDEFKTLLESETRIAGEPARQVAAYTLLGAVHPRIGAAELEQVLSDMGRTETQEIAAAARSFVAAAGSLSDPE